MAKTLMMVAPVDFQYNQETAQDNQFMSHLKSQGVTRLALKEFYSAVQQLTRLKVQVVVIDKRNCKWLCQTKLLDSVFPNNWFFTLDGCVFICGMLNQSRRLQLMQLGLVLQQLQKKSLSFPRVICLQNICEGTGVLVFDRKKFRVYINQSKRIHPDSYQEIKSRTGYEPVVFRTKSRSSTSFYHTNVMLSIGADFAVVCEQSIEEADRTRVMGLLAQERKVYRVGLQPTQQNFCCNILQCENKQGQKVLILSKSAQEGLGSIALELGKTHRLCVFPLEVIEKVGGGSARCMVAQLFPEVK